jgi:hypothetical protein
MITIETFSDSGASAGTHVVGTVPAGKQWILKQLYVTWTGGSPTAMRLRVNGENVTESISVGAVGFAQLVTPGISSAGTTESVPILFLKSADILQLFLTTASGGALEWYASIIERDNP